MKDRELAMVLALIHAGEAEIPGELSYAYRKARAWEFAVVDGSQKRSLTPSGVRALAAAEIPAPIGWRLVEGDHVGVMADLWSEVGIQARVHITPEGVMPICLSGRDNRPLHPAMAQRGAGHLRRILEWVWLVAVIAEVRAKPEVDRVVDA